MLKEEDVKEKLENTLNSREYQIYYEDNRNSIQKLWDNIIDWLGKNLEKLFPNLENSSGTAGNIVVAIIALIIILMAIMLIIAFTRNAKNKMIRSNQPFQSEDEWYWTYNRHMEAVANFEKQEEYTLATRHLFLAMLLSFHEKEWLEAKIWKTNWEYFDELKYTKKELAEPFYHFAILFDRATYGKQRVTKDEYLSYREWMMQWSQSTITNQNNV
ncbi:DUF4129 domain-containing protein [Sutcliffiella rhizosphaerae]|uniref:Protein-glutamine gamma-glutamyltransferase-like C-terminal domain-containing protein n=1 Tax=Sutcliffiella rhizosphaerae TaxID=2880967 RepID=A0ABN8AE69_9BACI|nr:DUF4129 domain-containing protein [Sutcliffiella rhizosphaerae]CAG9623580.1 hypothetical protein BACCIP111883_04398 [Sutcliffiella rhizosphaerae]